MIQVRRTEFFDEWLARLKDEKAKARIAARIDRLAHGNPGDVKPAGGRVSELRIDYGPGYQVYFTRRGKAVIICCTWRGIKRLTISTNSSTGAACRLQMAGTSHQFLSLFRETSETSLSQRMAARVTRAGRGWPCLATQSLTFPEKWIRLDSSRSL